MWLARLRNGRIFKHLPEMPPVEEAVRRAERLNLKIVVPALVLTGAAVGGVIWVLKKSQKGNEPVALDEVPVDEPECVISFETSLRAYVEQRVGRASLTRTSSGSLSLTWTPPRRFSEEGNPVSLSFEQLMPLFELVIAHTPTLAKAYSVELGRSRRAACLLGGQHDSAPTTPSRSSEANPRRGGIAPRCTGSNLTHRTV